MLTSDFSPPFPMRLVCNHKYDPPVAPVPPSAEPWFSSDWETGPSKPRKSYKPATRNGIANLEDISDPSSSADPSISAAIRILESHNIDLDTIDPPPVGTLNRLLLKYTQYGHGAVVSLLLEHGADPETRKEKGDRALHIACDNAHEHVIRILLDAGADVNGRGYLDQTPLLVVVKGPASRRARSCVMSSPLCMDMACSVCTARLKGKQKAAEAECGSPVTEGVKLFHTSAERVSKSILQLLLDRGADVKSSESHLGRTALHIAASHGDLETMQILLDHGADIEAPTKYGRHTPLCAATAAKQRDAMQFLLDRGANIEGRNSREDYKLLAAQRNLPAGTSHQCKSPLYVAVLGGEIELVKFLLDRGAKVDSISEEDTPLIRAMITHQIEIAKILLKAGADIHFRDSYGATPLHYSVGHTESEMMVILLDRGADIEAQTLLGHTPLVRARWNKHHVKILLERGANIEARDEEGNTLLCLAAKHTDVDQVRLALEKGAKVDAKNKAGKTPLQLVRTQWYNKTNQEQIIELLLDEGARGSWRDILSRGIHSKGKARGSRPSMSEMPSDKVKLAYMNDDSDESCSDLGKEG